MRKNCILLLSALVCFAGKVNAQVIQPCGTDEMAKIYKQQRPEIAVYEKQLETDIANYLSKKDLKRFAAKKTSTHSDTDYYDIPLVVHVMHNYGNELIKDDQIYKLVAEMNRFYSLQNDTTGVVKEFKKYVGKAKFRFHLATKDPYGNPTKGITHHFTYLAAGGDDNAKMDQWPQSSYVNIWFEQRIGAQTTGGIIVAYATQPPSAAAFPYSDGIICNYSFINDGETIAGPTGKSGGSIDHEMGHIFNLYHTFGHTNNPHTNSSGSCTDDDGVDDTPPTEGNLGGCSLFDSVCAFNYYKIYSAVLTGLDSLADYPDTSNEQNIMNYADCKSMFTKGQVERMRAALNSDVAGRNNLWDSTNLAITGALSPLPDLPPVADYCVKNGTNFQQFTCPGTSLTFSNACWGDTLTAITWTFTNSASIPSVTNNTPATIYSSVNNSFTDPGWMSLTIAVTGNNAGGASPTTTTFNRSVFVADATATPGASVWQDFNGADTAKWPMFNYYNNEFKWKMSNVGMYDNTGLMYTGFDSRYDPINSLFPITGSPLGDFDDIFSIPVDLTGFAGSPCYLNYNYSGASRSSRGTDINDTLQIDYSVDNARTWVNLTHVSKSGLCNKGAIATSYVPSSPNDWAPMAIPIPSAAQKPYVVFRFRYRPGVSMGPLGIYDITDGSVLSSGNNFYMDRLNFSSWPASVANARIGDATVAVVPNPTTGNAFVILKDVTGTSAQVIVTDVTGKTVYSTNQVISGSEAHIEIPQSAIAVKGMYLVQTITGNKATTLKLVSE